MKRRRVLLSIQLLTCLCMISGYPHATDRINGKSLMNIEKPESFSTEDNASVSSWLWIPPSGCIIEEGQGTNEVKIYSTYLAKDSHIKLIRSYADETKDTLTHDVAFHRPVSTIKDYTVAPGESIVINGTERSVADIYYEYDDENSEFPQITAHRLTVEPKAGVYVEMTKPYLQTVTSTSIWICWKTDFDADSKVYYGENPSDLSKEVSGTNEALSSSYFWHSVQLTGLEPNTLYSYKVKSGNKESEVYRFRTAPEKGSKTPLRILLMGDHQIKTRSGYEWLFQAAKRKIEEKYGSIEENIAMIMNVGDQVDVGTLDHYEHVHLFKSELLSPYLPIMTAIGNHETYYDTDMKLYTSHFHYEELEYKGIKSETEYYYAYQIGRILYIVLDTEHTGNTQKAWVRKVADAVKTDESVDFVISVNHRPIQAEQYTGDISAWARNEIMPILAETEKHILNYGGHHHLYHRGQWNEAPFYHIINGAASWDQMWGMSSEQDYDDVQKTIDYWAYQILEFDFDKKEMKAECYAIGNRDLVLDNILIDSFHRRLGKPGPDKPILEEPETETINLPYTFNASPYSSSDSEVFNTSQFQVSTADDFSILALNVIRDVENLYTSTGQPWHIPVDLNEGVDITRLAIADNVLKNGKHFMRVRYRDANLEWSDWSDAIAFTVEGSIDGDPAVNADKKIYLNGEKISLTYEFAPVGQNAWVGIYKYGKNPGSSSPSVKWAYTVNASGTLEFNLDETGEYYAVLFGDGGYTEAAPRVSFYVGPVPAIEVEKSYFEENEVIPISFSNAPGLNSDWIGIYKMGHTPGNEYSASWLYTPSGSTEGNMELSTGSGNASILPKGFYFITYFINGGYFEIAEHQYISVGKDISSVSVTDPDFAPDEDIIIYYADGPGTPKDWVGVFEEGKMVGIDELDGFYYTYGETDGYVTIPAGELKAADYFVSLYINDSYDEVSPRINISVGRSPELYARQENKWIYISFEDKLKWRNNLSVVLINGNELDTKYYKAEQGKITISTDNDIFVEGIQTYRFTVKSEGWRDTSVELEVNIEGNTSRIDKNTAKEIMIYPNPVEDLLYITNIPTGATRVSLMNTTGTVLINSEIITEKELTFSLSSLPVDTYFLIIYSANDEKIMSSTIIKK